MCVEVSHKTHASGRFQSKLMSLRENLNIKYEWVFLDGLGPPRLKTFTREKQECAGKWGRNQREGERKKKNIYLLVLIIEGN